MDAFFCLNPSVVSGNSQAEYKTRFQKHLGLAYKKATEEAERQPAKYKISYDKRVWKSKLEGGDKVFIWDLSLGGKTKITDEETPYFVLEIPSL